MRRVEHRLRRTGYPDGKAARLFSPLFGKAPQRSNAMLVGYCGLPLLLAARADRATKSVDSQRYLRCAAPELCTWLEGPSQSLCQGKADRDRPVDRFQQLARVELPRRGAGRGAQLPSGFVDAVAAANDLVSAHHGSRRKQAAGARVTIFPTTSAAVAASDIGGKPSGRVGCAPPHNAIGKAIETAGSSANGPPRPAAAGNAFDQRTRTRYG